MTAKVNGKQVECELVKQNALTVLVRLSDGNIIKRHILKHGVELETLQTSSCSDLSCKKCEPCYEHYVMLKMAGELG